MILGNNIAKFRKLKKIKQQELADMIGIERTSLSHIETGLYNPSAETMIKISNALGVPIGAIFYNPNVSENETGESTEKEAI